MLMTKSKKKRNNGRNWTNQTGNSQNTRKKTASVPLNTRSKKWLQENLRTHEEKEYMQKCIRTPEGKKYARTLQKTRKKNE